MKKIKHFLAAAILVCGMLAGLLAQTPVTAAAANTFVYESSDMVGQGGYIYFIRHTSADSAKATVCRRKVAGGKVTTVVSEPEGITSMAVGGQYLYYTSFNDKDEWIIRMCRLNGSDVRTLCKGTVCYADTQAVYGIRMVKGSRQKLFGIDLDSGEEFAVKTAAADQTLDYVTTIGTDSFYYLYNRKTDRLILYRVGVSDHKLSRVAVEKRAENDSSSPLLVSDVQKVGSELYYDYGCYEGTGNYWYGTVKKTTAAGKKKTVAKNTADDTLMIGTKELYFSSPTGEHYKYQLATGKKSKYSLELQKSISYTILGDKTYMADTSDSKKITVSRFQSGTQRETLTKNFITIPFQQKKNVSYTVRVKQIGIYNMVCVTGTDYDASYGWRGKVVSINWYITDGAGTVLGSFQ